MAHFAEIDENNIVKQVLVVDDLYDSDEAGQDFLANVCNLGGTWIKTSYNTLAGEHRAGGQPLRKNFAGIGYTYDKKLDAFIPPKPFDSWVLDKKVCQWKAPIPLPNDLEFYEWDEDQKNWVEIKTSVE